MLCRDYSSVCSVSICICKILLKRQDNLPVILPVHKVKPTQVLIVLSTQSTVELSLTSLLSTTATPSLDSELATSLCCIEQQVGRGQALRDLDTTHLTS